MSPLRLLCRGDTIARLCWHRSLLAPQSREDSSAAPAFTTRTKLRTQTSPRGAPNLKSVPKVLRISYAGLLGYPPCAQKYNSTLNFLQSAGRITHISLVGLPCLQLNAPCGRDLLRLRPASATSSTRTLPLPRQFGNGRPLISRHLRWRFVREVFGHRIPRVRAGSPNKTQNPKDSSQSPSKPGDGCPALARTCHGSSRLCRTCALGGLRGVGGGVTRQGFGVWDSGVWASGASGFAVYA